MPELLETADKIMDTLALGNHLYPDVRTVIVGKLSDRWGLIEKAKNPDVRYEKIVSRITKAMNGLLKPRRRVETPQGFVSLPVSENAAFQLMRETADYYRTKYQELQA